MLSALKELDRIYREIESEVFGVSASQGNDISALSEPVTRNRQLVARLEQVNASFSESAAQWMQRSDRLACEEREQVRSLAESARLRACRLLGRCQDWTVPLEAALVNLQQELGQVRNGKRFLQSSRPAGTNYPKFIDSHG